VVYGCNIADLKSKLGDAKHSSTAHKNTRLFKIRLLGHWWDENSKQAFDSCVKLDRYTALGIQDRVRNAPPDMYGARQAANMLWRWNSDTMTPTLLHLFEDLPRFEALENVVFETLIDYEETLGPQFPFIRSSTVAILLRNLPLAHDLKELTLDLAAGADYDEPEDIHICEEVAIILPRIETVRIRLKLICTSLFNFPENVKGADVRLKRLMVKLPQPAVPNRARIMATSCNAGAGTDSYCKRAQLILR
jgi:hypothetical protein